MDDPALGDDCEACDGTGIHSAAPQTGDVVYRGDSKGRIVKVEGNIALVLLFPKGAVISTSVMTMRGERWPLSELSFTCPESK